MLIQPARSDTQRLRAAVDDAVEVYGIVYAQLTAGTVDDHERIMRATNELAEAARRLEALGVAERKQPPGRCALCDAVEETRPDGPQGREVCFDCGTKARFGRRMRARFGRRMNGGA